MIESKRNDTCGGDPDDIFGTARPRDVRLQIYISLALGLWAFLTFCFLRPRWKGLYAARKKQNELATALPNLPDTFFGWIVPLWNITEEQVLASAGLDAYVYLAFFKMAIKFLVVTLFFALAVIKPVHDTHQDKEGKKAPFPGDGQHDPKESRSTITTMAAEYEKYTDYLWMYLVFVYLFTALIMYLIVSETRKIIEIRQRYLGSQTTITDRTIRLSGIPQDLREEQKIKEFIEDLQIGQVESVTLCKGWKELDDRMAERFTVLRKLEEAWTVHLGSKRVERSLETLPVIQPRPPEHEEDGEASHLLNNGSHSNHVLSNVQPRPTARIWYGRFKLQHKNVDAIDYYEEKLRRLDDEIRNLRKKDFEPMPLAFVTMDSVASAQMAIQAVLDPSPLQLLANNCPAPSDVVWTNTYLSRRQRIFRSWSITIVIGILSIFWTILFVPIAGALSTCSIQKVFPRLALFLESHDVLKSLVNTQLPTLALTLINVLVPFLYDWLANKQGMISQGDVELSVISKNFFFTFFNFFILFTILGTASGVVKWIDQFGKRLTSATELAYALATSLADLLGFYTNYIILQGFGLFPFRLLEFGALSLYPIYLIGAKTPRDYAELVQPPVFSYGFFLPQTILIFIICMVYSVLKDSWQVLLVGLAYFMIGHFVHKYQLLYAMEHRQHSTGRGWTMMCDRTIVGVVLFQVTVAGQLALKKAFKRAVLIVPLVFCTLWFFFVFARTYRPLMKFIALRSLRNPEPSNLGRDIQEESIVSGREGSSATTGRLTLDEAREKGSGYRNGTREIKGTDLAFTASMASGTIYLSRGVAGTKSEPSLPVLDHQPLYVASYFESSDTRRLSLSPRRLPLEPMSQDSAPIFDTSAPISSSRPPMSEPSPPLISNVDRLQCSTKRSEVLRHMLPHPIRGRNMKRPKSPSRVVKPMAKRADARRLPSKPKAFHKYISSFFNNSQEHNAYLRRDQSRSRASSFGSKLSSSAYSAAPSVDVVSPAAFMFSGPSLRSGSSFSHSTSRITSLAETDSETPLICRAQTDSFYMLEEDSIIDEEIMEPDLEHGITRVMSDVLLGVSTPINDELTSSFLPVAHRLPLEILQDILRYLYPKEFNAARRTCRTWMRASLDKNLLRVMLKRGGWHSSAENSLSRAGQIRADDAAVAEINEWKLSRHLARQCALASGWAGNGLDIGSVLSEDSHINFEGLSNGHATPASRGDRGLNFSTSLCGQFLCVARDTLIYIYDLRSSVLQPITSVVSPRRVLSMSMDVSSGRHAIAALLEGRMGMVCELRYGRRASDVDSVKVQVDRYDSSDDVVKRSPIFTSRANSPETQPSTNEAQSRSYIQEQDRGSFHAVDVISDHEYISLRGTNDGRAHERNLVNDSWPEFQRPTNLQQSQENSKSTSCGHSIPLERGTSTFYRHLCSEDDPPRSVSICPQRRCVAFGCSAGIELHWIDALTGRGLNRWFPLTAPSDHLFFLSPRPGIESAKKLRLISSAAHPDDRPSISRRFFSRPTVGSFWGSFGFESINRRPGSPGCDHYHAIPMSDGFHVLYIDPATDHLTLGCDAPLGGPTKLLRKIVFLPSNDKGVPRVYTAAADMSQGALITVLFGDTILLYNIPRDWNEPPPPPSTRRSGAGDTDPVWPLAICGTEIGRLAGVCELALRTQPDITLWAFTNTAQCQKWRLRNYVGPIVRTKHYVCHNGMVHHAYSVDEGGDIIMEDAPSSEGFGSLLDVRLQGDELETPKTERSAVLGFDGTASGVLKRIHKALAVEYDPWVDFLDLRGASDAWYEDDGSVIAWYGA
ncbi:DUF221-domain-containing protein [Plenodomus tracheiphilus IPT5]|uniref:DUF221-domain-containing protein n=1 Tax=Plenodomus tracheiphilus IPT5 TaxID=1408161 RepID=A0A6A7BH68_9PLEO|nr:DUF221-domain-containing protein [Plenodomus tracheiphilus IPT5]